MAGMTEVSAYADGSSEAVPPLNTNPQLDAKETVLLDGLNKTDEKHAAADGEENSSRKSSSREVVGSKGNPVAVEAEIHGFERAEMHSSALVGSVDLYERHVFLCYKDPLSWPPNVEAAEFDRLPRYLVAALKARKNDMPKKTRLTLCEGHDGNLSSHGDINGDVLIFPDMLKYRQLTHLDVDAFVEDVLVKRKEWVVRKPEHLSGSHIFVCAHASRDARCGFCGPLLIQKLKEEITTRNLDSEVFVRACSHVGGHKYAGNLIIYNQAHGGDVVGHWYGYVTPDDVVDLLEQHILKGKVVERLWRGQMGLTEEEQKKAQNGRAQVDKLSMDEEARGGCMCGESGVCYAQEVSDTPLSQGVDDNTISMNSSLGKVQQNGKGPSEEESHMTPEVQEAMTKGRCRRESLGQLFKQWEMEDTLVTIVVIGAAASVGLAYYLYRRSSS